MKNTLVVSGHPELENSFANKTILEDLQARLPEAEMVFLDRLYPNYRIDADAEQKRLLRAEVIVMQFPLFWYGVPALMKKWMEDVFVRGFAHGSKGRQLQGRKLVVSFTSGAPEEMYCEGGAQGFPIEDYLPPLKQFANLCSMEWAGFVYSGGLFCPGNSDNETREQIRQKALAHAGRLETLLTSL